jgi:NTE family protein
LDSALKSKERDQNLTAESSMSEAMVQEAVNEFRTRANGQVVLVLQGGGALGTYQVGVYQALHEAGVEPDWIIGTSIGAINASIITGNKPQDRLAKLNGLLEQDGAAQYLAVRAGLDGYLRDVVVLVDPCQRHPRIFRAASAGVLGCARPFGDGSRRVLFDRVAAADA